MPTLKFHIKGQRLEVEPIGEILVENSVNFLKASVTLDNLESNREWLGLTLIKVGFYHNGKNYPVEVKLSSLGDKSEEFFIPWEAIKTPGFVVSVIGTKYQEDNITLDVLRKITTSTVPVQLKQSGSLGGIVSSNFGSETDFVLALQILEEKVGRAEDTVKRLEEEFEALENLVKGSEKINVGVNLLQNSQLIHHYSNVPDTLPRTEVEGFDEKEKYYFYRYTYDHAAKPNPAGSILVSLYNQIPLSDITVPLKIAEGSDADKDIYTFSFWARAKTEGEAVFSAWIGDKNISQDTLEGINGTLSHGDKIKLTSEWTRYHMTIKLERNYDSETGVMVFCPGDIWQTVKEGEVRDLNYYIDLCNWKIEKGDKPTNWSSSLEKYEKQATEIRTSLLQTKEAIIAEVDGKIGDLEGNVTEVTNQLTVDINGIDMKCTEGINGLNKSFADFKVTANKIASIVSDGEYGVNLLVNSGLKSGEDYNSEHWIGGADAFTLPRDENGEIINWSHAALKNSFLGKVYQIIPEKAITPDEYYVLSLNVKVEKAGAENDRISLFEAGKKNINSSVSYEKIGSATDRVIYLNEERDWTRYSLLLQYPKDKLELYQSKDNYELIVGLDFIHIGNATVCVKEMKLERGVIPTDWAPGDEKKYTSLIEQKANEISSTVTEQIGGVVKNVSEISQRADNIAQSVTDLETGINSKIEQTADSIKSTISSTQNLLENSSFSYETVKQEGTDEVLECPEKWKSEHPIPYKDKNGNLRGLARISTSDGSDQIIWQSVKKDLKRGKKYTASVKFLSEDDFSNLNLNEACAYIMVEFKDGNENIIQHMSTLGDYSANTGWKTVQITFDAPEREYVQEQVIIGGHGLPENSSIYFKEAKLELGEEATEWEENQFYELELSLDGLRSQVDDVEEGLSSNITQTASNIRTEISNLDANVTSRIEQAVDQISQSISSPNLLRNSSFHKNKFFGQDNTQMSAPLYWWTSGFDVDIELGMAMLPYGALCTLGQRLNRPLAQNCIYTLSIKLKISEFISEEDLKNAEFGLEVDTSGKDGGDSKYYSKKLLLSKDSDEWKTYSFTFTTDKDTRIETSQVVIWGKYIPEGIFFREAQLERGAVATPWAENTESYLTLTEDGVYIGNYDGENDDGKARFAGPNIRLGTDSNGYASIFIRDNNTEYASFGRNGISLKTGTDTDTSTSLFLGRTVINMPFIDLIQGSIKYYSFYFNSIYSDSYLDIQSENILKLTSLEEKNGKENTYGLILQNGKVSYFKENKDDEGNLTMEEASSLHYTEGDSFEVLWVGAGFITSSKTHIHFCIPISKTIPFAKGDSTKFTCEWTYKGGSGGLLIRQNGNYKYSSAPQEVITVEADGKTIEKTRPRMYVRPKVQVEIDNDSNFLRIYAEIEEEPNKEGLYLNTYTENCGVLAQYESPKDENGNNLESNEVVKAIRTAFQNTYTARINGQAQIPDNNDTCGIEARMKFTIVKEQ